MNKGLNNVHPKTQLKSRSVQLKTTKPISAPAMYLGSAIQAILANLAIRKISNLPVISILL